MVRLVAVIAAKDLTQRFRDRSAYLMGIVAPLALVFILNATLASADDPEPFRFAVHNADQGQPASGFVELLGQLAARDVATIDQVDSSEAVSDLVAEGDVRAGFVIDDGFSDAVMSGRPARITVIGDREAPIAANVAASIAEAYAGELERVALSTIALGAAGVSVPDQAVLAAAAGPIAVVDEEAAGRGYDTSTYFSVSLSVFFLFFTVQFGLLSLLEEREVGTMQRLLASPLSPGVVLAGKLVASLVLGVVVMAVLIGSTTLVIGADWGSPPAVAALTLAGVLTAMALISLVAAVARTAEQASNYGSIVAVVLGLLGGTFFPVSQAPRYLEVVSWLSPHRWLLDGFRDVSTGAPVADLAGRLVGIAAFVAVAGGIGTAAAARRLSR